MLSIIPTVAAVQSEMRLLEEQLAEYSKALCACRAEYEELESYLAQMEINMIKSGELHGF